MRKIYLILGILIVLGFNATAQLGTRVTNSIASICPPLNWTNSMNMAFNGPVEQGENENQKIQTRMEIKGGSRTVKNLKEFVDRECNLINTLVSRSSFKTNSGIIGEKIVWKTTSGLYDAKCSVLKIQYFFYQENSGYSNCVIITCSVLESKSNKYNALFDGSAKTFEYN